VQIREIETGMKKKLIQAVLSKLDKAFPKNALLKNLNGTLDY